MAVSGSASRRRSPAPGAASRSGAAMRTRTRARPLPGKVDTRICDVSDPASVKDAMKATLDAFGRVDGCFANAGIGGGGRRAFIDPTQEGRREKFPTKLHRVFPFVPAAPPPNTQPARAGDKIGRPGATPS